MDITVLARNSFEEYLWHSRQLTGCLVGILFLKLALFLVAYFKARRQFPGPPIASILSGNLPDTMTDDIHEKWRSWHRTYGPVYQTVSVTSLNSV